MFKKNKKGVDPEAMQRLMDKARRGEMPTLRELTGLNEEQKEQIRQINAHLGRHSPPPS